MISTRRVIDYSIVEADDTEYYVEGICTRGSRFYSETFMSLNDAYKTFDLYKALVKYFGGGTVELIAHKDNRYVTVCPAVL